MVDLLGSEAMGASRKVVAKLAEAIHRLNLIVSSDWLRRLDAWRKHQPAVPTRSEAIRALVTYALDVMSKTDKRKG
jgi:hypothetical protein